MDARTGLLHVDTDAITTLAAIDYGDTDVCTLALLALIRHDYMQHLEGAWGETGALRTLLERAAGPAGGNLFGTSAPQEIAMICGADTVSDEFEELLVRLDGKKTTTRTDADLLKTTGRGQHLWGIVFSGMLIIYYRVVVVACF